MLIETHYYIEGVEMVILKMLKRIVNLMEN